MERSSDGEAGLSSIGRLRKLETASLTDFFLAEPWLTMASASSVSDDIPFFFLALFGFFALTADSESVELVRFLAAFHSG